MTHGVVVAGAGQAGLQVAVTLRDEGYAGPVTLIGREPYPPYQRPPLSKGFLQGEVGADSLHLRTPEFYTERGIELILGDAVTTAEAPNPQRGGSAEMRSGRTIPFDYLVIATGAISRSISVPGADLNGVISLRTVDDARAVRSAIQQASRLVVVGGGFIGLEAAAAASRMGLDVTVVEFADRLVGRAVSIATSEHLRLAHEARGIRIRLGSSVIRLHGYNQRVTAVELHDGSMLEADLVLVGIGAIPDTRLAEAIGTDCRGGVIVDAACRTSLPSVLAVGDCTVGGHAMAGEGARLESVQNATEQGRVAALTILGRDAEYDAVPFFWSDQGDSKLQIIGWAADADDYLIRGNVDAEPFSVLAFREGRLAAAECVGAPHDFMAARRALTSGRSVDLALARNALRPLKECFVA